MSASDRLIDTCFEGVYHHDAKTMAQKRKKRQNVRPNKRHLKFPLYLDEQVGFTSEFKMSQNLHDAVSISNFTLFKA